VAKPPSTTDLIQIRQIGDGVVVLKDGTLRAIIEVTAINFDLRSSDEQTALLQQFQGFLNSVDFPIQMIVHSRRFDITEYLKGVEEASSKLTSDLLKLQAGEYMRYVKELAELSNVMAKHFYVCLALQPQAEKEAAQKKGFLDNLKGAFAKKPAAVEIPAEQMASYQTQLQQRAGLITGGLSGMGLKGKMLKQAELEALFRDLYNPVVPMSRSAS
jgi:type IV secretory pathway VirB4 component